LNLNQSEADALRLMPKLFDSSPQIDLYTIDEPLRLPATSLDGSERFLIDIDRCLVKLSKWKYQERAKRVIPLMRIDIDGPGHPNPFITDEERRKLETTLGWPFLQKLGNTHIHIYIEGYQAKWAFPLSIFPQLQTIADSWDDQSFRPLLIEFLKLCNFQSIPPIVMRFDGM
jgi:hypothetical protein